MDVIRLPPADLARVAEIDRSERVDEAFHVVDGALRAIPVDWDVPSWAREGRGEHSLYSVIEEWQPVVDAGGILLGIEGDGSLAGMAIVVPEWEPVRAWLAFLYVTRATRRQGVAGVLWSECEQLARQAGAGEMCVSAVPSGPAVRFYLSRGCVLSPEPHPVLAAMEPDDIQLVRVL